MTSLSQTLFDSECGHRLHRPVFGWATAVIVGTALGFGLGHGMLWLGIATAVLVAAWRAKETPRRLLCLLVAACALTAWRAALAHDRNAAVQSRLEAFAAQGETFGLKGVVSNDRQIIERKRGGPYCRFSVDDAWLEDGTPVHGVNLQIHYYDKAERFPEMGEVWQMQAKLHKRRWGNRMSATVYGDTARFLPEESRRRTPQYGFRRVRDRFAAHLALGVSPEEARLTQTMVLGTRERLPYAERRRYADAGIIHIFAISGLHVGIIAAFLIWFFSWAGLRLRLRGFLLLPTLLGYLLLTGMPPSAVRACVMALLVGFAPFFFRRADLPSALFATAAGVLLLEPGWVANAGAILSFGVMGGILLWMRPLTYFANRLMRSCPQRTAPGCLPLPTPWHLHLRRHVALASGLAWSAWLASFPLTLYFFGRVSLAGLLLNLVVPAVTLAVVWCACASIACGFFFASASVFFNRVNAFLLALVNWGADCLCRIPGAVLDVEPRPGPTVTLLMVLGLLAAGMWARSAEMRLRNADPLDPLNRSGVRL